VTASGVFRVGTHRPEHVYEGAGTGNPQDDEPVASFLGDPRLAARNAAEFVVAANTMRLLDTSSFAAEYRVEYLNSAGDWIPAYRWTSDQFEANRHWNRLRPQYPGRALRMAKRWVTGPEYVVTDTP
jgi:hypothetical protein